jgi:phosphatidylglycerophosphatase C
MTVIVKNPTIVAFDFDGTMTRGESFFHWLWFVTPWWRFIWCLALCTPALAAYVIRLISNDRAKARVIKIFLRGRSRQQMELQSRDFANQCIPKTLRPQAIARLHHHQKQGHHCVLVSATLALYLRPWAELHDFEHVIATELAIDAKGRLTGVMATVNCYGPEKAVRLNAHFGVGRIFAAYGDSSGDTEMLAMAENPYYRLWR